MLTSDVVPGADNFQTKTSPMTPFPNPLRGGEAIARLRENVERVILGKPESVRLAVAALLAGGHLLIEDVPGVGKSTLARALARSIHGEYQRIQFTPDLLPSDITGVAVYDRDEKRFDFKPGPVFANVVLADEINRTTPRTQSALLEAMNAGQVTCEGRTHPLPRPFLVMATQNPLEFTGTYPLPESQLDRFLLRIRLDYPSRADERAILECRRLGDPLDGLQPVVSAQEVETLVEPVREVTVEESVVDYIQNLVDATRAHKALALGASPRATLGLYRATQAWALTDGRDYVLPDDVKTLAVPVLAHRLLLREDDGADSGASEAVVREILDRTAAPS